MNTFLTSDHHFGHSNVIKYSSRPFSSVEEMDFEMIRRWNAVVSKEDRVVHVGDFSFSKEARTLEILSQLNGYKILVRGNHDKGKDKMLMLGFNEVHDQLTLEIGKENVLICHYPYRPENINLEVAHDLKYMNRRPVNKGKWLIHGHVHTAWKIKGKMINMSVENWDYTPVSLVEISKLIEGSPVIPFEIS